MLVREGASRLAHGISVLVHPIFQFGKECWFPNNIYSININWFAWPRFQGFLTGGPRTLAKAYFNLMIFHDQNIGLVLCSVLCSNSLMVYFTGSMRVYDHPWPLFWLRIQWQTPPESMADVCMIFRSVQREITQGYTTGKLPKHNSGSVGKGILMDYPVKTAQCNTRYRQTFLFELQEIICSSAKLKKISEWRHMLKGTSLFHAKITSEDYLKLKGTSSLKKG